MELFAFIHLYAGNGTGLPSAVEIFLEVKDIPLCTGNIQFFWINDSAHDRVFRVAVKLENKILI